MTLTAPSSVIEETTPVRAWRIAILLAALFAEGWNIVNMIGSGERASEHFGYFTVHSNLLVMVVLAWMLLRGPMHRPAWFDDLRGAVTAYIVLTGLVYAVLLAAPDEVWSWNLPFTIIGQHRIIPIMMAIDWLVVPTAGRPRLRRAWLWMLYPLAFLACSWLRGLVDGWYPYPFLDPQVHGGYAGLVIPTGQVLVAFVAGIMLVAVVGVLRRRFVRE